MAFCLSTSAPPLPREHDCRVPARPCFFFSKHNRESRGSDSLFLNPAHLRVTASNLLLFPTVLIWRYFAQTRKAYGRFWFRFMNGESGADVYDRATAFWESVFRSMDHTRGRRFDNYVIITHGLMMVGGCNIAPGGEGVSSTHFFSKRRRTGVVRYWYRSELSKY